MFALGQERRDRSSVAKENRTQPGPFYIRQKTLFAVSVLS